MTTTIDLDAFKTLPEVSGMIKEIDPHTIENITFIRERRFAKGREEPAQNLCSVQFEVNKKDSTPADKYKMTMFLADGKDKINHLAVEFTINDKNKVIANPSYDLTKKTANLVFELIEGSIEQSIYDISGGELTFLD